ncbi:MAG: Nif3-like dinuclear metal center hexameric protein [Clostridiales bacterium]|nr:Nif3-like dinuclear metal center hexameric protein [Clostridiales bacterium]
MGVLTGDLIREIEKSAPPACAESWDNSGWQIRLQADGAEINTLLVALELTDAVCAEAESLGAELALTHHPLFFVPQKCVDAGGLNGGAYAARLIRAGVSVYSAHTSFDAAPGGMNDCLAARVGLKELRGFPCGPVPAPVDSGGCPIARRGVLADPLPFAALCAKVEAALGMQGRLKTIGDPAKLVRAGAVCGGAGGDFIPDAIETGLDFFLTSDVSHHQAQWAKERGLCLIDGGHFGTENLFAQEMAERLAHAFPGLLTIVQTSANLDPWG